MDNSVNENTIRKWEITTITDMSNLFPSPGTTKEDKATRPPQKG